MSCVAWVDHFEGPDRIGAILTQLKRDGVLGSKLVVVSSEFQQATRTQLLRAHAASYISFVFDLHQQVLQQGAALPFTPRVQSSVLNSPPEGLKSWSDTFFSQGSLGAALRAAGVILSLYQSIYISSLSRLLFLLSLFLSSLSIFVSLEDQ